MAEFKFGRWIGDDLLERTRMGRRFVYGYIILYLINEKPEIYYIYIYIYNKIKKKNKIKRIVRKRS